MSDKKYTYEETHKWIVTKVIVDEGEHKLFPFYIAETEKDAYYILCDLTRCEKRKNIYYSLMTCNYANKDIFDKKFRVYEINDNDIIVDFPVTITIKQ